MVTSNGNNQESPATMLKMALASRLLTEMNRRGLNGKEFAIASGLHESDVSRLKRGTWHANIACLYEALGRLGVIITVSIPE